MLIIEENRERASERTHEFANNLSNLFLFRLLKMISQISRFLFLVAFLCVSLFNNNEVACATAVGEENDVVKLSDKDFGAVLIAEIMYNPVKAIDSVVVIDGDDDDAGGSGEWVELFNPSTIDRVDISRWTFADEKNLKIAMKDKNKKDEDKNVSHVFQFPENTIIEPKARIVVVRNLTKFESAYPALFEDDANEKKIFASLPFKLSNKGEKLLLMNTENELVHEVEYNDKPPWPTINAGHSIELLSFNAQDPFSWISSLVFGGTPLSSTNGFEDDELLEQLSN